MKSYGQFCGVARALEMVGERWALLIVRDLLVGSKRYTDLKTGLPRIPTNVLATRLKELEAAGIVVRRVMPRPAGSVVYQLTEYGRELDGIVLGLGRWGAQRLGAFGEGEIATAESLIMALRSTFDPDAAAGHSATYELRFGDVVINARVENAELVTAVGPADDPDLVIEAGGPLNPLLSGQTTAAEEVARGNVRLAAASGREVGPARLQAFAALFPIRPVSA